MVGRTYADWDNRDAVVYSGSSNGYERFSQQNALGERVVGYSLYGHRNVGGQEDVRHAFVWQKAGGNVQGLPQRPPQKMSKRPLELFAFRIELSEMSFKGYYAAYIGVLGHLDEPLYSAIYEPGLRHRPEPEVILDTRWSLAHERGGQPVDDGFVSQMHRAGERGLYGRSVGVSGIPTPGDFGAGGAPGLRFSGTLWPRPESGFGWSVQLYPNRANARPGSALIDSEDWPPGPWKERWETRAMAIQAYPVAGVTTPTLLHYGSFTLTLWHDVRYAPWPTPKSGDPFSEWKTFKVLHVEENQLESKLTQQREIYDRRPLSIGASFDGGKVTYFVPLGRRGDEAPLPRHFVQTSTNGPRRFVEPPTGPTGYAQARGAELDAYVRSRMERSGARHAQLVVVRRGELVHARAYTNAESGYPIATLDNAMRVASVSKILTAFMTWARVIPALSNGYDTLISAPSLLNLTESRGFLNDVRVVDLMTHNSGFVGDVWAPRKILDQVLGPIDLGEPGGQVAQALRNAYGIVEPGWLSKYLQLNTAVDYFDVEPGTPCHFYYVNHNYILLGECIAHLLEQGSENYSSTVATHLLEPCGILGRPSPLYARGWSDARDRNESPGQDPHPSTAWNTFDQDNDLFPMTSGIYARDGVFEGAAGGWCVPLVWIARILAGLTGQPSAHPYLDRATMEKMASLRDPSCTFPDHINNTAIGCVRQIYPDQRALTRLRYKFNRHLGSPDPDPNASAPKVIRIHHNGMTNGGSALLMHQFPEHPENPLNEDGDAISFALALSMGFEFTGENEGNDIFDILQKMEWYPSSTTFPDHDLFDDL